MNIGTCSEAPFAGRDTHSGPEGGAATRASRNTSSSGLSVGPATRISVLGSSALPMPSRIAPARAMR